MQIKQVGIPSNTKMFTLLGTTLGLIVGLLVFLLVFISGALRGQIVGALIGGLLILVIYVVIGVLSGAVSGVVTAVSYNFVAKRIGGIEVDNGEIKKIEALFLADFSATYGLIYGIIAAVSLGIIYSVFMIVGMAALTSFIPIGGFVALGGAMGFMYLIIMWAMLLVYGIIAGTGPGFTFGLIIAPIYSFLASKIGGIKIETNTSDLKGEIKRIGIIPTTKIFFIIGLIFGICAGVLFLVMAVAMGGMFAYMPLVGSSLAGGSILFGIIFSVIVAIGYPIIMSIIIAIVSFLYNAFADVVGGIKIETE